MTATLISIALGGASGSVLRALVFRVVDGHPSAGALPINTLFVNVLGSFVLGLLLRPAGEPSPGGVWYPGLTLGLCGGFTTFSTFSADMLVLLQRGEAGRAGLYALLSVTLSLAAVAAGYSLARALRPGA